MTNYEYVKLKGYALLKAKLSNNKEELVRTYVTAWGHECSEDTDIIGMSPMRWFETDDDTVEVCYPDEFEISDSNDDWVDPPDGIVITKIIEFYSLEDGATIIDTWEDEDEREDR